MRTQAELDSKPDISCGLSDCSLLLEIALLVLTLTLLALLLTTTAGASPPTRLESAAPADFCDNVTEIPRAVAHSVSTRGHACTDNSQDRWEFAGRHGYAHTYAHRDSHTDRNASGYAGAESDAYTYGHANAHSGAECAHRNTDGDGGMANADPGRARSGEVARPCRW
jgi:hypothetical protein